MESPEVVCHTSSSVLPARISLYQLKEWEEPGVQENCIGSWDTLYVVPSTMSAAPEADEPSPVAENLTAGDVGG